MRRNITDYIYLLGFILYVIVGTIVSLIVLPFLITVILAKRFYLFILSHFCTITDKEKELKRLRKEKRALEKGIKKIKKRTYKYENLVVKAREHEEKGETMLLEEAIEGNYADLQYLEDLLEEATGEIAKLENDPENCSDKVHVDCWNAHPDRG